MDGIRPRDIPLFAIGPLVVLMLIIAVIIIAYAMFRLLRKFGFPYCSGSTEACCICSPYCYCAGVHLRKDHTGTAKVIPCSECCYGAVCGCERPPPELMTPVDFLWTGPIVYNRVGRMANRLGFYSHEDVICIMQQPLIVVITQPTGGQEQEEPFHL